MQGNGDDGGSRDAERHGNGKGKKKNVELKTDVFFCRYSASLHPRISASLEAPLNFSSSKRRYLWVILNSTALSRRRGESMKT